MYKVLVIMGSETDMPTMGHAITTLKEFDVKCDIRVLSAHRTPLAVEEVLSRAEENYKVVIAGAGGAAHLAGVCASHTTLPVIGVPMPSEHLNGLDSLLSTVQMPGGMPVLTVAIGKAGAKNAALGAVQMLSLSDDELREKLHAFRRTQATKVLDTNNKYVYGNH